MPMGDVVDLKSKRPHRGGAVVCLGCKHEWYAIIAVEDDNNEFQCPECSLYKGVWQGKHQPPKSELVFTCACGNDLFHQLKGGRLFCTGCGSVTLDHLEGEG